MSTAEKRIAKIYFEANVFLTTKGELYGYTLSKGKPHCDRLTARQKIAFWEGHSIFEEAHLTNWNPVASSSAISNAEVKYVYPETSGR